MRFPEDFRHCSHGPPRHNENAPAYCEGVASQSECVTRSRRDRRLTLLAPRPAFAGETQRIQ